MKVYSSNSVINPTYENVLKKLNAIQIQSLGRCTKSHSEKKYGISLDVIPHIIPDNPPWLNQRLTFNLEL
jgi:hypothetical protein